MTVRQGHQDDVHSTHKHTVQTCGVECPSGLAVPDLAIVGCRHVPLADSVPVVGVGVRRVPYTLLGCQRYDKISQRLHE